MAGVFPVKYDNGAGRFFIADNDDIPGGTIVQAETNPAITMLKSP